MTIRTNTLMRAAAGLLFASLPLLAAEPEPAEVLPAAPAPASTAAPAPTVSAPAAPPAVSAPAPVVKPTTYSNYERYESGPSSDMPLWLGEAWASTADVLHEHLRIGVRYRQINLQDDSRDPSDSFLGSITELNTQSDYEPITWFTFDWLMNPYIGVRLDWEQVRAETSTSQETASLNHSDGNVDLFGPSLMLLLRLPNRTRLIPTGGVGYAWLNSTFEHNPVWQNGFGGENREQAYDAWVANGSYPWPNGGYQRNIVLDDTTAWILYGELAFQITDHLDIHAFIQSMDVEGVDLSYELSRYGNVFQSQTASFPMSNTSYGAGLRWTF